MMKQAPHKLRGANAGKLSELTRLKALPARERMEVLAWRDEQPTLTNEQIRARIKARFGINLRRDGQLSEFWAWQFQNIESGPPDRLELALYRLRDRLEHEVRAWWEELRQELKSKP